MSPPDAPRGVAAPPAEGPDGDGGHEPVGRDAGAHAIDEVVAALLDELPRVPPAPGTRARLLASIARLPARRPR